MNHKLYKNIPGIYKFENKINHKCYIGQSSNLYTRIKQHLCIIKHRLDKFQNIVLYKAIKKYGFENFEINVVCIVPERTNVKRHLDLLERHYIKKYKSFTSGYNCTKGGDGGILGHKMTQSQINTMRIAQQQRAKTHSKKVYMYNIHTKTISFYDSLTIASKQTGIVHSTIEVNCRNKTWLIHKTYLCQFTKDDLAKRICDYYEHLPHWNKTNKPNSMRGKYKRIKHGT